jgi:hypothetical protein
MKLHPGCLLSVDGNPSRLAKGWITNAKEATTGNDSEAIARVGIGWYWRRLLSSTQPAPDIKLPDRAFLEFQSFLEFLFHDPSPELSLFVWR